jgi:hypothetical protein
LFSRHVKARLRISAPRQTTRGYVWHALIPDYYGGKRELWLTYGGDLWGVDEAIHVLHWRELRQFKYRIA